MCPQPERRLSPRTRIDRLTYIELPGGNGGIAKDLSEGGIGFCAVVPLETSASVPVSIRIPFAGGLKRVAANGDLAWTDDSRKSGGLRFTELAEESREQIRRWHFESNAHPATPEHLSRSRVGDAASPRRVPVDRLGPTRSNATRAQDPCLAQVAGAPEMRPSERRRSRLVIVGAFGLVGVIGFMSNGWYRDVRDRVASKSQNRPEVESPGLPPGLISDASPRVAFAGSIASSDQAKEARPVLGFTSGSLRVDGAKPAMLRFAAEPAGTAPGNDFVFVQVGLNWNQAEAQRLVESLRRHNFVAYASELGGTRLYRVQLGPYVTDEAANLSQGALQKAGFDAFLRFSP